MDEDDGVINRRSKKNGKKKSERSIEGMGESVDELDT